MHRLTVLGGLDLVGPDGRPVHAVLRQPKRLAVLVNLALAGSGAFRRRDEILGLFWPESDQQRARGALGQTLRFLRRALGPAAIVNRGLGEVGTSPDALWCDATAFAQALRRGDAREALSLYRGDLLPGFFIDAGPEFEHWLDEERRRLRRYASQAAWGLATAAERDGRFVEATGYGRRSVELAPAGESSLRALLELLDRIGDRGGALDVYERFAARLAAEHEVEPSAETRRLVERIRSVPDAEAEVLPATPETRAPAGVEAATSRVAPSPPEPVRGPEQPDEAGVRVDSADRVRRPAAPDRPAGARRSRFRRRTLAAVAAALCLAGTWHLGHRAAPRAPAADTDRRPRVAVHPLANLGAPGAAANLGQALTAAVVDRLARVPSLDVVSGQPAARRRRAAGGPESLDFLVTGSVLESGGLVRVTVQITDAASGRLVKSAVLDHAADAPPSLVEGVAARVSSLVQTTMGREVRLREWGRRVASGRGYELMVAADDDRQTASRLAGLGELPTAARALASADSLLREAEREAPGTTEPVVERAYVLQRLAALSLLPPFRDRTRTAALLREGIGEAARAVAHADGDAAALEALGSLVYWSWLVVPLPADSARRLLSHAERSLRRAVAADPGRASAWSLLSASLYARGDHAGAYLAATRAYRADTYAANAEEVLGRLVLTSYEVGDDSASASWCEEIGHRFRRSWTGLYCQLALLAWTGGGDRAVERAWSLATAEDLPSPLAEEIEPRLQMLVAAVLARSGLRDSAEVVIRRARTLGGADPELLPLEADARLQLGQPDVAAELLSRYVAGQPLRRAGIVRSRRFRMVGELQ